MHLIWNLFEIQPNRMKSTYASSGHYCSLPKLEQQKHLTWSFQTECFLSLWSWQAPTNTRISLQRGLHVKLGPSVYYELLWCFSCASDLRWKFNTALLIRIALRFSSVCFFNYSSPFFFSLSFFGDHYHHLPRTPPPKKLPSSLVIRKIQSPKADPHGSRVTLLKARNSYYIHPLVHTPGSSVLFSFFSFHVSSSFPQTLPSYLS